MRFIQTLVNSIIIFTLVIIIGVLFSMLIPALGKSLHNYEYNKKKAELERMMNE